MKDKITIGIFTDAFFPMVDGVILVIDNYARRLVKKANVIVFAPDVPGSTYDDSKYPYKVVRCKSLKLHVIDYSLPTPKIDKNFMRELELYKLDVVHIHSPFEIGKLGVKYAKKHHIPAFGTMHSQIKQDVKRAVKLDKLAGAINKIIVNTYNKCDECFAVNQEVANIFHSEYGFKGTPLITPNATDLKPILNFGKHLKAIDEEYNIKKDEKVFLFVGRLNNLKNIFFIVESLKILKDMNTGIKFKMLFVGAGQDEDKLRELIKKRHMEKEIFLCGLIRDRFLLATYYRRADLFLFPSFYDTNSLVQIEATSQYTPTLFLEGAVTASTVTDGVNGFISKNDPREYAKYIEKIMTDEKLYKTVSKNCHRDLYVNWDMVVNKIYERYMFYIKNKNRNSIK